MRTNWILPPKPGRLLTLVGVLAVVWLGDRGYRWWRPNLQTHTAHYVIRSSATPEQTAEVGRKAEILHAAYREFFRALLPAAATNPPRLKLNLYRDRAEFRRCNRGVGWAEAFYREPCCHAYFPTDEASPWQWMIHEAVHQLNREVAGLKLAQWADEGVAEYFSTSRFIGERLRLGVTDPNTYPIWWLDELPLTGDLDQDLAAGTVMPLRAIVSGRHTQDMGREFNRFYLHWWSLVQFLMEHEGARQRAAFLRVLREGASLESFERHLGPIERVQEDWYQFLLRQKKLLGAGREQLPERPAAPTGMLSEARLKQAAAGVLFNSAIADVR